MEEADNMWRGVLETQADIYIGALRNRPGSSEWKRQGPYQSQDSAQESDIGDDERNPGQTRQSPMQQDDAETCQVYIIY